jgi:hypothetical protein
VWEMIQEIEHLIYNFKPAGMTPMASSKNCGCKMNCFRNESETELEFELEISDGRSCEILP